MLVPTCVFLPSSFSCIHLPSPRESPLSLNQVESFLSFSLFLHSLLWTPSLSYHRIYPSSVRSFPLTPLVLQFVRVLSLRLARHSSFSLFISLSLSRSFSFSLTRARIHSDAYVPTSPWLDEIRTRVSTDYTRDRSVVCVACHLYVHVRDSSSWSRLHARERGNANEGRPNPRDLRRSRCRRVEVPLARVVLLRTRPRLLFRRLREFYLMTIRQKHRI